MWIQNFFRSLSLTSRRQRPAARPALPRHRACFRLEPLEDRTLLATSFFVDLNNVTGVSDGTALRPFTTIQAAVTAAPDDTNIMVAQGTYAESVVIPSKDLQLLGGFVGGTAAAYAAGQAGDFATATPTANVTQIVGSMDAPVLFLQQITTKTILIDGFTISGGHNGIYVQSDFDQFATVTISHNIIENNGPAELQASGEPFVFYGGGIYSNNATLTVANNIIRNNNANRGGGLAVGSATGFTIADNLIENNSGYDDHGGGVALAPLRKTAPGSAIFTRNIVRGNVASKAFDYGWGGGLLVAADLNPAALKPVILSHNVWTDNYAPSIGGAIFVDNGATLLLDHELIYRNRTATAGGGAIFVNGDESGVGAFLTMVNCTVADNSSGEQAGNGINIQEFCQVTVSNSIFWGNGDDFAKDATSTLAVSYTDSQDVVPGIGNFHSDPLFADAAAGDYHLRSTGGRFDPVANGGIGDWLLDAVHSPAIDAGKPTSSFVLEPAPNGGRVNLGAFGNTAQASRTALLATTTELVSSASTTVFGAQVTFTATVRVVSPTGPALSGRVRFFDGASELGSVPLAVLVRGIGKARLSTRALGTGTHTITAVYEGNNRFPPSTSVAVEQIVNQASTRTTLRIMLTPVVSGQTVTLISRVLPVVPGTGKPTGTITFLDGTTELGTAPLQVILGIVKATLPWSARGVATHQLTAVYSGDDNFTASVTALPVPLIVRAAATKTVLTSSDLTVVVGTPVTFTAVVSVRLPGTGAPTGTFTFWEGTTNLGTAEVQVIDGKVQATLTFDTLSAGRHLIRVRYNGDMDFKASWSVVLAELVSAVGT
jgi:hypothetical protein